MARVGIVGERRSYRRMAPNRRLWAITPVKSRLRHLAAHSARAHARHSTPSRAAERRAARGPTVHATIRAAVTAAGAATPTIPPLGPRSRTVRCPPQGPQIKIRPCQPRRGPARRFARVAPTRESATFVAAAVPARRLRSNPGLRWFSLCEHQKRKCSILEWSRRGSTRFLKGIFEGLRHGNSNDLIWIRV